jgi:hypothetical protein
MRRFLAGIGAALLAGCGEAPAPPVEILGARVGVMRDSPVPRLVPATRIALDGSRYAWIVFLRTNRPTVAYTEEITLAAPRDWVMAPGVRHEVTPDRRGVRIFHEVAVMDGTISGMWLTSDLPPGRAEVRIVVEGKVEQRLEFELVRP